MTQSSSESSENNVTVVVVKELENDNFKLSEEIAKKFGFKQIKTILDPVDKRMKDNSRPNIAESAFSSQSMDMPEEIVEKGEIGNVIIQKIKTILPNKNDKVTIDSILYWMSNEGLKRIENIINEGLLQEVNVIQLQSRDLGVDSKFEFLQKMDMFQNHYIGAQNAKESKRRYFDDIIKSELPSLEFRYLIRHLKSRMGNLHNTTVIIERRLELARNRFLASIDANISNYSRDLDALMKKFAVIATLFLPLQLISGMLGMNIKVPFQNTDSTWPFWALTGLMIIGIIGFWLMFKKYKYL